MISRSIPFFAVTAYSKVPKLSDDTVFYITELFGMTMDRFNSVQSTIRAQSGHETFEFPAAKAYKSGASLVATIGDQTEYFGVGDQFTLATYLSLGAVLEAQTSQFLNALPSDLAENTGISSFVKHVPVFLKNYSGVIIQLSYRAVFNSDKIFF